MYDVMKRHEIQVLKTSGLTNDRVAESTGVSPRTVQRIAKEPPVETARSKELAQSRSVGRPSKVGQFRKLIEEILAEEPELPTVEVLHRLRQKGYTGGKSAVYGLVSELRSKPVDTMVRFEGLPGEFSQHDFGQVDVVYSCGKKERLHFFASRLKYSRWVEIRTVPDQRVESLVRALLSSFSAFGGVPLVGVFDNAKTVVIRRHGSKIEWNETFGRVALDYRFAPELCTPRRANEKGSVENLVGWVKGSFFKVRRFHDRDDLERQLQDWHREANEERPSRATGVTPAERMLTERPRLRPLSIPPQEYALRFATVVGPTARVPHDGYSYSMPPKSIGFPATLFLYVDRVHIVAGKYEAEHRRYPESGHSSFLSEHRAEALATVSGDRGRLYFKRQQLLDLGSEVEELLTEIVHRHPRTWRGEVEILFELLQRFGDQALRSAVAQAVTRRLFGATYVATYLEKEAV